MWPSKTMQQCLSDSPKRKTFLAISVSHTTLKSILRICLCLLRVSAVCVCVCCAGPKKYLLPYRRWTRGYGGHKLYFLKLTVSCAARERHWERTLWQLLPSVLSSQSQELPEFSFTPFPPPPWLSKHFCDFRTTLKRTWNKVAVAILPLPLLLLLLL